MLRALAAAACLLLLPAAASAQDRQWPIEEMAADLAYGFCPLYLAGRFSLTGPELAERGFGKTVSRTPFPGFGEMQVVEAKLPDGRIGFGGVPGKSCSVIVQSPNRAAVLARLRSSMSYMGLDFQPAPAPTGPKITTLPETLTESFRAPVESQFLHLQLVQIGGADGAGPVLVQLFASDK